MVCLPSTLQRSSLKEKVITKNQIQCFVVVHQISLIVSHLCTCSAACVMYECALRLNVEGIGEKGLRQQAKCYLACLNCLHHIPPEQAWILKPLPKITDQPQSDNQNSGILLLISCIELRSLV